MQPKSLASIFLSDDVAGQPRTSNSSTSNSPQMLSSSLSTLLGDTRLRFPALYSPSEALRSHMPEAVGHIPAGITAAPAGEREEMWASRDGQAARGEEPCCKVHCDEHRLGEPCCSEGRGEATHYNSVI